MIGNKYKATMILLIVSVGFLISYPFQNTFLGGLLASGFRAAMIGGLADWFAVSALFRRPLGIPYRTAIIPRNREKIFVALAYMVEHQILMKENIKKRLDEYDLSMVLLYFMDINRNQQDVRKMLYRFLQDFFSQIKADELQSIIGNLLENNMRNIKIVPYLTHSCKWIIHQGYDEKMMNFIIDQCILVVDSKKIIELMSEVFLAVQEKYERGMNRRKIFNRLMDLSSKQLATAAQHGLRLILTDMKINNHPTRIKGKIFLENFILKLENDSIFQESIESCIQKNIISRFGLGAHAAQMIMTIYSKVTVNNRTLVKAMESIMDQFNALLNDFTLDQEERTKLDLYLKNLINQWIDTHHDEIGKMVKDSLNRFTNDKLVSFIEDKLGNDLQMIRINGSVVGGFVGMMIHLLTFWL